MKSITVFVAHDGTRFDTVEACQNYERRADLPPQILESPNYEYLRGFMNEHLAWLQSDSYHEDKMLDQKHYLWETFIEVMYGKENTPLYYTWKAAITSE